MSITISREVLDTLSQIENILRAWKAPSLQTCERYERYLRPLIKSGINPPDDIAQSRCSRTYYFKRAAYIYAIHLALYQSRQALQRAKEAGDEQAFDLSVNRLRYYFGQFKKTQPDPEFRHKYSPVPGKWKLLTEKDTEPRTKLRSSGKRPSLRGKPGDWRLQIWGKSQHSKYQDAIAVLALTGCRPSELEKGIDMQLSTNGKVLITIRGSKVTRHSGQELRSIEFTAEGVFGQHLARLIRAGINEIKLEPNQGRYLSDCLRAWSKQLWPRQKHQISCYSFRHAASADFKRQLPSKQTSAALGHRAERTKRYYGTANQSKKGLEQVTQVSCSTPVKSSPNLGELLSQPDQGNEMAP